jgi:type IV pilus assembly protein PilX
MKQMSSIRLGRRGQRGVVLFVALIVLIVMTLAGLALLRQMGAGTSIAGNIAFKESATFIADRGTEVAVQYVQLVTTDLTANTPASGYAATWVDGLDPTTLNWGPSSLALADDPIIRDIAQTGNSADVIIQRLCQNLGSALAPAQRCSDILVPGTGCSHIPGSLCPSTPSPFYRVTTRVLGPRGTVSYTQVLMQ